MLLFFPFLLEHDTFVVWEMFPGNDGELSDSGEEEDFYFSDNNWSELQLTGHVIV